MDNTAMVAKRDDPNYSQLAGHIPNELATQFKIECLKEQLGVSEGLEAAIRAWVEQRSGVKQKS
ncbi:MAG: hypothetical protein ACPGVO_00065 [Spirulinaceae cyanobacterium]